MPMPSALSLRQGIAAKCSPPFSRNVSPARMAISSSVSRQSAEKPGVITATVATPDSGQLGERHVGIGLEPLGPAEARLERDAEPVLRPAEPLAQQPRRLLALAMIGVALVEIVPRQAVERGDHHLRLEVEPGEAGLERRRPARRYRPGRRDRAAACGSPAASASPASAAKAASLAVAVVARGILRIERARRGCGRSPLPSAPRAATAIEGVAIAHRPVDDDAVAGEHRRRASRPAARVMVTSGASFRSLFQTMRIGMAGFLRPGR